MDGLRVLASGKTVDQHRGTRDIEDSVLVRQGIRETCARRGGRHLVIWNEQHALHAAGQVDALRDPLLARREGNLEAAVDGRRDVVCVTLLLCGHLQQQLLRCWRRHVLACKGVARREPSYERRRAAAHATRRRDGILALEAERRALDAERFHRATSGARDHVVLRAVEAVGALARDGHGEFVGTLHYHPVPHIESETERVEAGTEIGGRSRHIDDHLIDLETRA